MFARLRRGLLLIRVVVYALALYLDLLRRNLAARRVTTLVPRKYSENCPESKNIVIIGASFSGYHAARVIATSLPIDGQWRIVIIEPNHHFQYTWTLPRFCVVEGHEHKTFIPYGPYIPSGAADLVRWVHHRAETISRESIKISETGEIIPYEYLVIATGASSGLSLPSRVGAVDKTSGVELFRRMQRRIKQSKKLVIIGGAGAGAGVELATDAKQMHPDKIVTLVHSRNAVMHRFGPELQAAAAQALRDLGVEVLLNERIVQVNDEAGSVVTRSGRKLECDFCVGATGQTPSSQFLQALAPEAVSKTGHIRVKHTMQIDVPSLSNVYACGDVAETNIQNPNARSAMRQAQIVGDNVILAVRGQEPIHSQHSVWVDSMIKLTVGLNKSITHISDGHTELLVHTKEKDEALNIDHAWKHFGAKPY